MSRLQLDLDLDEFDLSVAAQVEHRMAGLDAAAGVGVAGVPCRVAAFRNHAPEERARATGHT